MKIRTMEVEPAWAASGVQGFFGTDKYWYHKVFAVLFGMWFLFTTFVSKTSTLHRRRGNMPLGKDGISPKEWIPRCIVVKWWKRVVLNAVGLSGPGLGNLLARNQWQKRGSNFFISLMSVAPTLDERKEEIRESVRMIIRERRQFQAKVGAQLNVSCPNVGPPQQEYRRGGLCASRHHSRGGSGRLAHHGRKIRADDQSQRSGSRFTASSL
jgi:dihydroorotate dehydrogenase